MTEHDPHPELPGTHLELGVTCPRCGWTFPSGMRNVSRADDPGVPGDADTCVCVCSKCFVPLIFGGDGSNVRQLTREDFEAYSKQAQEGILTMMILTHLAMKRPPGDDDPVH